MHISVYGAEFPTPSIEGHVFYGCPAVVIGVNKLVKDYMEKERVSASA